MSIRVQSLTKRYGPQTAVNGISFEAHPGEIVGFLGPNGAGKSTTLKMITGYLSPDSGTVTVCGKQVADHPIEIRQQIGYLPELNPLYYDLYVREYLQFVGETHQVDSLRTRVEEVIGIVGLTREAHKRIGALSKGYKQRVGLAAALIHEPQVLILDEPTTGLDPQARHLMWERLQMLMQEGKSILLTTHFMDEAERLCDRLLVIDHGKKIAEGKPRDLIAQHLEPDVVELYGHGALDLAAANSPLRQYAARVEVSGETVFFYTAKAEPLLVALQAWPHIRSLHRPANLEDLFLKLTGRQIRENA